jgi:hypothetical protein
LDTRGSSLQVRNTKNGKLLLKILSREGSDLKLRYLLDDYNGDSGKTFRYESDCLHENLVTALRYENEAEDVDEMLQTITKMTTEEGRRFMLSLPPQVKCFVAQIFLISLITLAHLIRCKTR